MSAGSGISDSEYECVFAALRCPPIRPLPPASPTLKTPKHRYHSCNCLHDSDGSFPVFVPVVGYFFAGTFGAIALINDHRRYGTG